MNIYKMLRFNHNLHKLHTNAYEGPSADIKGLIKYNKNTQILTNLISKFLSRIQDKDLERDIYSLLYNNKLLNQNMLLSKYPELRLIASDLTNDFKNNTGQINLIFTIDEIISIIRKHNSALLIPANESLLIQKKGCLAFRAYNTPTFTNPTITPLVGMFIPDFDLKDLSPSSIYKQWVIALLMLSIEFNALKDTKTYLESKSNLDLNVLDIKDNKTQYWLNRQLRITSEDLVDLPQDKVIIDFYSNKYFFYLEVCEDLTYVLLNLILGLEVLDKISTSSLTNNDEFISKLTIIIKQHYSNYSLEYNYLNKLRWLSINSCLTENEIISTYNYMNKLNLI